VFLAAVGGIGVAMLAGFGLMFSACGHAFSDATSGFNFFPDEKDTPSRAIPIPPAACPYLRLVSAAATDAAEPWRLGLDPSTKWDRFATELSEPLARLDAALGAAITRVPPAVAHDLIEARRNVEVGRVQLLATTSVHDYLGQGNVLAGTSALADADALVGTACNVTLAPLPF